MRKIFFLLVAINFLVPTVYANKIDSLHTSEEVQKFILEKEKYGYTEIDTFLKLDIDNNGYTDLVFGGTEGMKVVMDKGGNDFKWYYVGPSDYSLRYKLLGVNNGLLLVKAMLRDSYRQRIRRAAKDTDTSLHPIYMTFGRDTPPKYADTLIYRFNEFIEYNAAPSPIKVKSIRLSTTTCYGTCPEYSINIYNNYRMDYDAGTYTDKKGHFTGKIGNDVFGELSALLAYINVTALDANYAVRATDHPTAYLTIELEDGRKLSIKDYGKNGTHGLSAVYRFIDNIRTSQEWK